ncbi:MAG TPA: hypothetical protein VLD35_08035, partial [Caldimonas sp.]|nr:hypothetical protein [Caldimonas sp.]
EATEPPRAAAASGPPAQFPPGPAHPSDAAAPEASPIRIAPRRRRQTAIAAVATGAVGIAAIVALWLSIGRSFGPVATVSIPLPAASEAVAAPDRPAPPALDGASAPVVVAAATPSPAPEAPTAPSPETRTAPTPAATLDATVPASTSVPATSTAAPAASAAAAPTPTAPVNPDRPVPVERGGPTADELDLLATDLLKSRLPPAALNAERRLARVLAVAANATEFRRRGDVRTAMQAMRSASAKAPFEAPVRSDDARRLNEAALVAYWRRDDVADALRLQRKAFAANPFDSEVVGNLAFLQLRQQPPAAETARQLALHALALNDPRFPSGRIEDWTAFAVASALTGHETEARNAWFASMALASDLQHQCDNAVRAEAIYGERLRSSVQAMLQRARSSAAYGRCEAALSPKKTRAKRQASTSRAPAKSTPRPVQGSRRAIP